MATRNRNGSHRKKTRRRARGRRTPTPRTPKRGLVDRLPGVDALRMLKDDHRRVRELFDRYEPTRGSAAKQRLAERICEELKLHAKLEEQLFYPAAREEIENPALVNEADVEHATAKQLIAWIEGSSPEHEHFDAAVKVLGEYIQHHVREEEGELFRQVRRSKLDTHAIGEQMERRKRTLIARMRAQQRRTA